jgi:hypothetical protein
LKFAPSLRDSGDFLGDRFPQASTPRNKDRFLGTPVKRGANERCAYGAAPRWGTHFCAGV